MQGVRRHAPGAGGGLGLAGVGVGVEVGEVGAGDVQADAVAGGEEVAGREGAHRHLVDPAGLQGLRRFPGVAVARAQDAVRQVHDEAPGVVRRGRVDVDQFDGEVGVRAVGGHPELGLDGAGHLHGAGQGLGLEDEDVGPRRKGQAGPRAAEEALVLDLVEGAAAHDGLARGDGAADGGDGVAGVVAVGDRGFLVGRRVAQKPAGEEVEGPALGRGKGPVRRAEPLAAVIEAALGVLAAGAAAHAEVAHGGVFGSVGLGVGFLGLGRSLVAGGGGFEPAVEPAEAQLEEVGRHVPLQGRAGAEIDVARIGEAAVAVGPGAQDEGEGAFVASLEVLIVLGGGAGVGVVPAGHVDHGDGREAVHVGGGADAEPAPEFVVPAVAPLLQ